MLIALQKKLLEQRSKTAVDLAAPVGTLTESEPYDQLRYAEIDGIGTVTIDRTGNMAGFSPVERCKDRHGEIAWVPTELCRNIRLEPFFVTERAAKTAKT